MVMTFDIHKGRSWLVSRAGKSLLLFLAAVTWCINLSGCSNQEPPKSGPAASWQTLLSTAQKAADEVSSGSVLLDVISHPDYLPISELDSNQALELTFTFVTLDGHQPQVILNDVNPPTIIKVYRDKVTDKYSPSELEELKRRLNTVKLSPREVYEKTVTLGQTYIRQQGQQGQRITPHFNLWLAKEWQSYVGVPVVWTADYSTEKGAAVMRVHPDRVRC